MNVIIVQRENDIGGSRGAPTVFSTKRKRITERGAFKAYKEVFGLIDTRFEDMIIVKATSSESDWSLWNKEHELGYRVTLTTPKELK